MFVSSKLKYLRSFGSGMLNGSRNIGILCVFGAVISNSEDFFCFSFSLSVSLCLSASLFYMRVNEFIYIFVREMDFYREYSVAERERERED